MSEKEFQSFIGSFLTVSGVRSLHDVNGTSSRDNRDAKTEQEATALKLVDVGVHGGSTVDNGTDDDNPGADLHANLSSPSVDGRSDEEQSTDTSNLVHGRVDSSPFTVVGAAEEVEELLVGSQTTEDGSIKTVLRVWSVRCSRLFVDFLKLTIV